MPIYNVTIKTGDVQGAGTDAKVRIQLFGDLGETESEGYVLDKSSYDDFERGDQDIYPVRTDKELGNLEKVRLWHDNSGSGAGWYVDYIKVELSGATWNFPVDRWLAKDEDDRKIDVEFPVDTGTPTPFIKDEKTEYVRINRKNEIFDNLGNAKPLEKTYTFRIKYSNQVRYETTDTTEQSIGVTVSLGIPIKVINFGIEAAASFKRTLESKYGTIDSTEREVSQSMPIEVDPRQLLIVSGILVQETRVGTITRGGRSYPFQVPVGEPQFRESRFSYTKGEPAPDDAEEMAEILTGSGKPIPWE